jgi:hypothetical protein
MPTRCSPSAPNPYSHVPTLYAREHLVPGNKGPSTTRTAPARASLPAAKGLGHNGCKTVMHRTEIVFPSPDELTLSKLDGLACFRCGVEFRVGSVVGGGLFECISHNDN